MRLRRNNFTQPPDARGSALLELCLVVPLFMLLVFFSSFLVELACAKLRLQGAARYLAWELTSYPLDDLGQARHDEAFELSLIHI